MADQRQVYRKGEKNVPAEKGDFSGTSNRNLSDPGSAAKATNTPAADSSPAGSARKNQKSSAGASGETFSTTPAISPAGSLPSGKKRRKKHSPLNLVLTLLAWGLIATGAFLLLRYFWVRQQSAGAFSQLAQQVVEPASASPGTSQMSKLERYQLIAQRNPDMTGWVNVPGCGITLPVMYAPNNKDFYLKHDFDKKYNYFGVPYIAENNKLQPPDNNLLIYGHNIQGEQMFGGLTHYLKVDFLKANPSFTFDTLQQEGSYEIYAVILTDLTLSSPSFFNFYDYAGELSKQKFEEYIAKCERLAAQKTGAKPVYGDKLVTLCTCDKPDPNTTKRILVVAKKTA